MLNGAEWQGIVETGRTVAGPGRMFGDDKQFYFESDDDKHRGMIDMDSVKMVYIGVEDDSELLAAPRFFDAAPIPSSLWVRATLIDGEIVEGMIANAWSALSGPALELRLPGAEGDQRQLVIPRTSVAEFHVITTR